MTTATATTVTIRAGLFAGKEATIVGPAYQITRSMGLYVPVTIAGEDGILGKSLSDLGLRVADVPGPIASASRAFDIATNRTHG